MKSIITVLLLTISCAVQAQQLKEKPVIDTAAIFSWPTVGSGQISANSDYAAYIINNQPRNNATLVMKSLKSKWEKSIVGVSSYQLTDQDQIIYQIGDTLNIFDLHNKKCLFIDQTFSYKVLEILHRSCIAYLNKNHSLTIQDLKNNKKVTFSGVLSYFINPIGSLVLKKDNALYWASLSPMKERLIYSGEAENIVIDNSGKQTAFITSEREDKVIRYYHEGQENSAIIAQGIQVDSLLISNLDQFSNDGKRILLHLIEQPVPKPSPNAVMVDIWSWTDFKLQSQQLQELTPKNYLACLNMDNQIITRLQHKDETVFYLNGREGFENFALYYVKGESTERNWNSNGNKKSYFVCPFPYIKKPLPIDPIALTPSGKHLLGYDSLGQSVMTYDLKTGKINNLTKKIHIPITDPEYDRPQYKGSGFELVGFSPKKNACIFYDRFDIWQIDLKGKKLPVCLTNGYGRKNNTTFRLVKCQHAGIENISEIKILTATNRTTKETGFYELSGNKLVKLSMGSYRYDDLAIKAKIKNVYLIAIENVTQSKNFYTTSDFKTFSPISFVYPEKKYNWLTSELINFVSLNGEQLQGILYKPENFNEKYKYPCIIHYYEKKSNEKNNFIKPELITDNIDIPWFVSRGYLVFTPDIKYKIGYPGNSALNAVEAATQKVSRFSFVDATRIGLMGHSFGGFETNYIITHTNFPYAAAVSYSGVTDLVSWYGSIMNSGESIQYFAELHQLRIGSTLWEKQNNYLDNSPVLLADKITTPILMMSNKNDGIVLFSQGVEFFTALRRLGKRAWMLQYDNESHSVLQKNSQIDLTIRTDQFFDHYLKDAKMPRWMIKGVPAFEKGIDKGY